jgi:hypothetical protein
VKKYIVLTAAGIAALAMTVASAATSFAPEKGEGFVGKGDIQVPWGWSNKKFQDEHSKVSFQYEQVARYAAECYVEITTGNGRVIVNEITLTKTSKFNSAVAMDGRRNNQVTGLFLTGFVGPSNTVGNLPEVGDTCAGQGVITSITPTTSSGVLSASHPDEPESITVWEDGDSTAE